MIGLKINGENAELKPDTRIDIKLVNPLFNEDTLSPGSYTLPFELAGGEVSPINATIFKNLDVIENQEKFSRQEAQILFDDVPYKKGKIKAKTISPSIISTNFIFGLSTLSDEIKTKKIRELVAEEIVIDDSAITKKIILKPGEASRSEEIEILGVPTGEYRWTLFPLVVNGKTYELEDASIVSSTEQSILEDLRDLINANEDNPRAIASVITVGVSSGGLDAPYLVLEPADDADNPHAEISANQEEQNATYVLNPAQTAYVFTGYKWKIHAELGNADLDAYYDPFWTALEGYFTGDYPDDKLRFPVVVNVANVDIGYKRLYNGIVLDGVDPILLRNIPCSINSFHNLNLNAPHPFVRLRYVLDTIATYFGFEWEGDFFTSDDTAEMLIWNPNSLDLFMDFIGTRKFNFWKRSFNVKDLVPDLTVRDFLYALASRYNLAIDPNETTGKVRILHREPIAKSLSFTDITSSCSPPGPSEDISLTGIKLSARKESKDTFAEEDIYDLDDPEVTYETPVSRLNQTQNISGDRYNGVLTGPACDHPADDKFEFRIFYYKGLYDNGEIEYPKADINATNYTDTFDGENGLYENFWKRWLKYELKRRSVPIEIDFSFADLKNFDWEIKRRFDRNNYLIKTLDFSLENTRITACKAVIYTMV
jgi:hypothetical protein